METVPVALNEGAPTSLTWGAKTYLVADTPTLLSRRSDWFYDDAAITHPPDPDLRWRFVGRASDGESHVFDLRYDFTACAWLVVHVFD